MNKNNVDYFYRITGIIGACILLYGSMQTPPQPFYVAGSALLLCTAIYFRLIYFIALEIILISGHSAILLGIGTTLQVALPALLCVQLLFYYLVSGQFNNLYLFAGIVGIADLSIGFSYENQWVFLIGSSSVAIYAFYSSRTVRASLIWAILNSVFTLITIGNIITNYLRGLHG